MALSYLGFGVMLAWIVAGLVLLVGLGWVSLRFEAWRAVYLLGPLAVLVVMWRVQRGRR
jgi:hypothetical protein